MEGWFEVPDDSSGRYIDETHLWLESGYISPRAERPETHFSYPPTEEELIEALTALRKWAVSLSENAAMELAVSRALRYGTLSVEIEAYLREEQ